MAGSAYGWNLNHVPARRTFSGPPQIACRICNNVFMSTQALIDHIETHMTLDHDSSISASRRHHQQQQQQQQQLPSLNLSGGRSLISGQRNNNNFNYPIPSSNFPNNHLPFSQSLFSGPSFHQDRNFMFNPNPTVIPPRPTSHGLYNSPLMSMRNNYGFGSQLMPNYNPFQARMKLAMGEMNNGDCTKPLLQKLEKPITTDSNLDLNGTDDRNKRKRSEYEGLDLNLKL